jgi:hypothetical protein
VHGFSAKIRLSIVLLVGKEFPFMVRVRPDREKEVMSPEASK